MTTYDFSNTDDIIDSRDIIEAVENLESMIDDLDTEIEELEEEIGDVEFIDEDNKTEQEQNELNDLESQVIEKKNEKSLLQDELTILEDLVNEFEGYCSDWKYGVPIIHEDYIDEYLKDEVKDLGYIPDDFPHWIVIDWDETCDNLKGDYTQGDFDGETYYCRES